MPTTITLRLDDKAYKMFRILSQRDNRPLSNFIETAALRYIEESSLADEAEMAEIKPDKSLNASLKRGRRDAKARKGRFA
ncbi:CopG family transcriptional regulator [candidate division TA06 bacterium]|uniref:CopG family transcriptional regulator n=1 Tax=candidate division TA06 bacterium TaxID=2250710 RepID=A0A933I929_UNCT6|nr:CopG family transcriptional regulator [candidate division TA06 bacterium]